MRDVIPGIDTKSNQELSGDTDPAERHAEMTGRSRVVWNVIGSWRRSPYYNPSTSCFSCVIFMVCHCNANTHKDLCEISARATFWLRPSAARLRCVHRGGFHYATHDRPQAGPGDSWNLEFFLVSRGVLRLD